MPTDTRTEALNARITALEARLAAVETWADTTTATLGKAFERTATNRDDIAAVATADDAAAVDAHAESAHLLRSFIAPTGGPPSTTTTPTIGTRPPCRT